MTPTTLPGASDTTALRTRQVGVRLVRSAHALGVRDLAMEALPAPQPREPAAWTGQSPVEGGYLSQPDMRELTGTALGLGWRLWPYEAWTDPALLATPEQLVTMEHTNWREREQALAALERELEPYGGTAAVRREDADERLRHRDADAFVLSVDNALTE